MSAETRAVILAFAISLLIFIAYLIAEFGCWTATTEVRCARTHPRARTEGSVSA